MKALPNGELNVNILVFKELLQVYAETRKPGLVLDIDSFKLLLNNILKIHPKTKTEGVVSISKLALEFEYFLSAHGVKSQVRQDPGLQYVFSVGTFLNKDLINMFEVKK